MISFLSQDVVSLCCYDYILFNNIFLHSAEHFLLKQLNGQIHEDIFHFPWQWMMFPYINIIIESLHMHSHYHSCCGLSVIQNKAGSQIFLVPILIQIVFLIKGFSFNLNAVSSSSNKPPHFFLLILFSFILGHSVLMQEKFSSGGDNSSATQWTITRALNASPVAYHSDLQKWE